MGGVGKIGRRFDPRIAPAGSRAYIPPPSKAVLEGLFRQHNLRGHSRVTAMDLAFLGELNLDRFSASLRKSKWVGETD